MPPETVPAPEAARATPGPRKPLSPEERPGPARESTAGAPSLLQLGPYRVRVGKHTWGQRKEILALVRDRTPQPLAEFKRRLAALEGFPAAQQKLVDGFLDAAYLADREWPPAFLSPAFTAALFSPEALADALRIILAGHNSESTVAAAVAHAEALADLDPAEAAEFAGQYEAIVALFLLGRQAVTRQEVRESIGPKGEGGGIPPATTPPSGTGSIATSSSTTTGSPPTSTP